MKKVFFGLAFLGSFLFINCGAMAQESVPGSGEGFECKIELIRCNWYNADTRQVCHQNGDGLSCICGQSTTC
jgi:hypothetical protein